MEPLGGRYLYTHGDREYWCRPGKPGRHTSATTGNGARKDKLKVHTSNWPPFPPDWCGDKFSAYALIHHGGDFNAAASDLARQGYGERRNPGAEMGAAHAAGDERVEMGAAHAPLEVDKPSGRFLSKRLLWSKLRNLPPKPMLVDKILGVGDSAMIVGLRKGGKTAVTLDLLLAMIGGGLFAGKFRVTRPLTVAYLTTEGTGSIHVRLVSANVSHGVSDEVLEDRLIYIPSLPQLFDDLSEESILRFAEEIEEAGITLDAMVLDTFAKAILGAEENSNSDMSKALATLQKARERLGCATILLHHINKSGTIRGASAIDGDLDVLLQVEWDEESGDRRFSYVFAKDLGPFDAIPFELDVMDEDVPGSIRVNWTPGRRAHGMSAIDRILAVMRQDPHSVWTLGQIKGVLGDLASNTIQTALSRETDREHPRVAIIKDGAKAIRYRLTSGGQW